MSETRKPQRRQHRRSAQLPRQRDVRPWLIGVAAGTAVAVIVALSMSGNNRSGDGQAVDQAVLAEAVPAPAVALPATTGSTVDLSQYRGKRNVLLYFYEHAG